MTDSLDQTATHHKDCISEDPVSHRECDSWNSTRISTSSEVDAAEASISSIAMVQGSKLELPVVSRYYSLKNGC